MSERESMKADAVVRRVDERWGTGCSTCSLELIGHEVVLSLMLGFADTPLCAGCLASGVGQEREAFLAQAAARVRRLACFRAGWVHADRRLASAAPWPEERMPRRLAMHENEDFDEDEAEVGAISDDDLANDAAASSIDRAASASSSEAPAFDADYDAGDLSCGELVLELRKRLMRDVSPGDVLRVRATDPAAPVDLPSWCRLTRHPMVAARHPQYWIRRRTD